MHFVGYDRVLCLLENVIWLAKLNTFHLIYYSLPRRCHFNRNIGERRLETFILVVCLKPCFKEWLDTMVVPMMAYCAIHYMGVCYNFLSGEVTWEKGNTSQVAVKVLKEGATRETREDFKREVEIMSGFDHQNILRLLGVVAIGK